jgi:hypothetical protein
MKAIKSPFKFLFVLLAIRRNKKKYKAFCEIARDKHFYEWQWRLLDKIYKV